MQFDHMVCCFSRVFTGAVLIGTCFLFGSDESKAIPASCQPALKEVIDTYFKEYSIDQIDVNILPGGHSNTCLLITTRDTKYVLRIKKEKPSLRDLKRELFAMQEAESRFIAPHIYYVTGDCCAVLMEYIETNTLSLEQSRQPENIIKIAQALHTAHTIPPNPHFEVSGIATTQEVYQLICNEEQIKAPLNEAIALVHEYDEKLARMETYKVNIHGDLNPRNILLESDRAIFIDWEYTGWEDPFMDLSYLALRLDYNEQEEMLFLESYLQHIPSENEIERYYCAKKLNYAELTIYFFYFSLKWHQSGYSLDPNEPLQEWAYYVKEYMDKNESEISLAQYYYDMARCCLKNAHRESSI